MDKYMEIAKLNAEKGIKKQEGGPFGAVIIDLDGNVISTGNNKVFANNDPTAHAEIVAIRRACEKLKNMIYQIIFYIHHVNLAQCVYQQ